MDADAVNWLNQRSEDGIFAQRDQWGNVSADKLGKFCDFVKYSEKISTKHLNWNRTHRQCISLASRRRVAARHIAAAPATATAQHLRAIYATETAILVGGRWLHFAALSRARGPPAHIDMQSTLPKSVGHEFALLTLPLLHPRVQKQATNDVQASR